MCALQEFFFVPILCVNWGPARWPNETGYFFTEVMDIEPWMGQSQILQVEGSTGESGAYFSQSIIAIQY